MKTVFIALAAFFVVASVSAQKATTPAAKDEPQKTMYCCSMHPNETSMEMGKCPKCGMELVKTTELNHNPAVKGSQTSVTVKSEYICKMDGTTSDKPGECPKCGMKMTEKKSDEKEMKH